MTMVMLSLTLPLVRALLFTSISVILFFFFSFFVHELGGFLVSRVLTYLLTYLVTLTMLDLHL